MAGGLSTRPCLHGAAGPGGAQRDGLPAASPGHGGKAPSQRLQVGLQKLPALYTRSYFSIIVQVMVRVVLNIMTMLFLSINESKQNTVSPVLCDD